jgi:hypothetical protein
MNQKSEYGLLQALEHELKRAKEPLDCATLFDRAAVREYAASVNRVSDYLGNLWRKGQVLRVPAPKQEGTKARWMYVWRNKPPVKPDVTKAIGFEPQLDRLLSRPTLDITEDGKRLTIMLPDLTITIQKRS